MLSNIKFSRFLRFISPSRYLAERVVRRGSKALKHITKMGITKISEENVFRRFLEGYKPKKFGRFKTGFVKAGGESAVAFAIIKRNVPAGRPTFRSHFVLTPQVEAERAKEGEFYLAIVSLQGPTPQKINRKRSPSKKKKSRSEQLANEVSQELGEPAKKFMLKELVDWGKQKGAARIALIRPEHHPLLGESRLLKFGLSVEEIKSLKSQYYASAWKVGFRKRKGSKFLWLSELEN